MIAQPELFKAIQALNDITPAASGVKLGSLLATFIQAHNQLESDFNALQAKYTALLAHLDTANVAGIGNANTASFAASASVATAPAIGSL